MTTGGRGLGGVLEGGAVGFVGAGCTVTGGLALVGAGWGEVTTGFGWGKAGFDSLTLGTGSCGA